MALPKNTAEFRRQAPRYIASLMHDFGLTDFQAAGFPANAGGESNGFTLMQEIKPTVKGSKGGLGPFQWTGPRRREYEAWLKRNNAKPGEFTSDYGFLFRELKGPEKGVLTHLRQAKTVDEATEIVMRRYERPGIEHLDRRKEWGRLALEIWRAGSKPADAPAAELSRYEISTAQARLDQLGYKMVGKIDGVWGARTTAAVSAFQHSAGLPVTGELDDATRAALYANRAKRLDMAERAATTVETLAPHSPIVQEAAKVKTVAATIGSAAAAGPIVIGGILQNISVAKEWMQPLIDTFASIPAWVWGVAMLGVAFGIYRQAAKIEAARVAMHKVGETA